MCIRDRSYSVFPASVNVIFLVPRKKSCTVSCSAAGFPCARHSIVIASALVIAAFGLLPSEMCIRDRDYFLNEDDEFGEDFPGAEGFYI